MWNISCANSDICVVLTVWNICLCNCLKYLLCASLWHFVRQRSTILIPALLTLLLLMDYSASVRWELKIGGAAQLEAKHFQEIGSSSNWRSGGLNLETGNSRLEVVNIGWTLAASIGVWSDSTWRFQIGGLTFSDVISWGELLLILILMI